MSMPMPTTMAAMQARVEALEEELREARTKQRRVEEESGFIDGVKAEDKVKALEEEKTSLRRQGKKWKKQGNITF